MVTKKDSIGNELMREIIAIRVDTLWKMLGLKVKGRLPKVEDEGATESMVYDFEFDLKKS